MPTIDEAIKELETKGRAYPTMPTDVTRKAMLLGAEALKREESWRRLHPELAIQPLEGETED